MKKPNIIEPQSQETVVRKGDKRPNTDAAEMSTESIIRRDDIRPAPADGITKI